MSLFLFFFSYYDNLADKPLSWNPNSFTRLRLKDSVKSVLSTNDTIPYFIEFNSEGYIIKEVQSDKKNTVTKQYYYEENARLKSIESTVFNPSSTYPST